MAAVDLKAVTGGLDFEDLLRQMDTPGLLHIQQVRCGHCGRGTAAATRGIVGIK